MHKQEIFPIMIIVLMFAIGFYAYPLVQADEKGMIISHWGIDGQPNGWMEKGVGVFLVPILALIIYLGLLVIPHIEVYQENLEEFSQQFWGFKVILVFVMGVIYLATLIPNLGYWKGFDPVIIVIPAVSMLFFYVGYMLNFTKRNYFIGVRTPWTLADEKVWEKTNRLVGQMFWICGALTLISLATTGDARLAIIIVPLMLTALVSVVYSFYEYKKTKKVHAANVLAREKKNKKRK
ncbi:MAG: SdpI family protein [Candidatus Micrarchaeota archaeon]|nr:SdpI family protein [Candidatus Micrarchaeota archaeon]